MLIKEKSMLEVNRVCVVIGIVALTAIACAGSGVTATSAGDPSAFADLPPGDPAAGEVLFLGSQANAEGQELGCQACHSLDGTAGVGPLLQSISERIPADYESVEAYLRASHNCK
jgi:cytochrome c2